MTRDWVLNKIKEMDRVTDAIPIANDFIQIHRKGRRNNEMFPPFISAIIKTKIVTEEIVSSLLGQEQSFQFIANIPKDSIWVGAAINKAKEHNVGWGSMGDLMSSIQDEIVEGFQKKEYSFVERGLMQHDRVRSLDRLFDRVIDVNRDNMPSIRVVLLNEYELTAECIRHAREVYGNFAVVLRTNPNGEATNNAHEVAKELGIEIFQWGQFLGRINRP